LLAFSSGQMILLPGVSLEKCEAVRATLLRDKYAGYEITTDDQWDKDLAEMFNKYVGQARGARGLMVECLHLD